MVRLKFAVALVLGAVVLSSSVGVGVRREIAEDRPQPPDRASRTDATALIWDVTGLRDTPRTGAETPAD